jgi:hypothetical protein
VAWLGALWSKVVAGVQLPLDARVLLAGDHTVWVSFPDSCTCSESGKLLVLVAWQGAGCWYCSASQLVSEQVHL